MELRIKEHESRLMQAQNQSIIRLRECKAVAKHAVKLYLRYCEQVLERINAAITNSSYSAYSLAVGQVDAAGRF